MGKHEPKYCPFCDGVDTLTMHIETATKIKENKVVKGKFQVWVCSKCGNDFFYEWDLIIEPKQKGS